jgi:hypothetical protein
LKENEGFTFEITFLWDNDDIMADEITVGTQNWDDFNPSVDTINRYYEMIISQARNQGITFDAKFIDVTKEPIESYSFDTLVKPSKLNKT